METMHLTWVDFYSEFATRLLSYKNDRQNLIKKIQKVYSDINMKFPKMENDNNLTDIDPFTIFGMFNKGITNANRINIIKGMAAEFDIRAAIPDSFDGIPVLNNLKATFFSFQDSRGASDIDNLWSMFEDALALAENDTRETRQKFIQDYDLVSQQQGIRWNITMGLFWIRPYTFMNLDSRNRWFVNNTENMPADFVTMIENQLDKVPTAEEYLAICDACRSALLVGGFAYKNYPELSYYAWMISEQVNQENRAAIKKEAKGSREIGKSVEMTDELASELSKKNTVKNQSKRDNAGAALADKDVDTVHYWIYAPGEGAEKWEEFYKDGIMALGWGEIGDLETFASKDEMKQKMKEVYGNDSSYKNSAHATWQFSHEMKAGDIVLVKKGRTEIIGRGTVVSDYGYDENRVDNYKNIRQVRWTHKGIWELDSQTPLKTLTDITPYSDFVKKVNALFEDEMAEDEVEIVYPPYTVEDFLADVYMDKADYYTLTAILKNKMNIILQGAPGVGKTFTAKRLAYSMMGVKDVERVMMVQFHQSYSYEDFIMGFRPSSTGFELKKGAFYNFCKKAEIDSDNDYFFIIDEINRGNLSKIFGELFMLIENDKRGIELQLLYSDEKFAVPDNVYIIGMMNTADRSLAMLDYALRRRFAFFELKPGFESEGFCAYRKGLGNAKFDKLINCVENLNSQIASDDSLGDGFCIGHSYFCNLQPEHVDDQCLSGIVEYELIPLLKEYWFDEPTTVKDWSNNLRSAIK